MSDWKHGAHVETGIVESADIVSWLKQQAKKYKYLLIHTDEGVIWGEVQVTAKEKKNTSESTGESNVNEEQDGKLVISAEVAQDYPGASVCRVLLHEDTLQQARLFNDKAELRLWRVNDEWHYATIRDHNHDLRASEDEKYLLWGTGGRSLDNENFTLFVDGEQGLRHAAPVPANQRECAALLVRHYWEENTATGLTRHQISRLVGLTTVKLPSEVTT